VTGFVASYKDEEFGKLEVTYWIGKQYWGNGVATKALSTFLDYISIRPIYGRAAKDNIASLRVLQKCGFEICGENKGFANARGQVVEEVILRLEASQKREFADGTK
jgi:RimJ/RimL family protein N-acetyltransferase